MSHESESNLKTQVKLLAVFAVQMIAQGALLALGGHLANKALARRATAALPAGEGGNVTQLRKAV
jgi:hypothetical protein